MTQNRLIAHRYRLVERLGGGGMGVVWRAYDERLHRKVAVKQLVLPPELAESETRDAKRRAMREGRIAARLQHPHSIAVFDVIEEDGEPYLIMEYLPSRSLWEVLAERGVLPPDEAAKIGTQLAAALTSAHAAGVVHRDVKPGNVLLDPDGTVKITDFGISRAVEDVTLTATGMIAGTPAYLAPEVARGEPATFASDVYSLGATLYAAVEGRPPFGTTDNAIALLHKVASGQSDPPVQAGPLTGLLTRMLDNDPAARPTMAEVGTELADEPAAPVPAVAPPAPPTVRMAPEAPRPEPARPWRRRPVLAVAAVVLLAVIGVVLALVSNRDTPSTGTAAPPASSAGPAPTTAPTSEPAPTSAAGQQPAGTVTEPQQPPETRSPQEQPQTPATPQDTITDYYRLVPGNLTEAWTWLTPKYQRSPAGGWSGYQTFWGRMRGVQASEVQATGADTVEATVEYQVRDGRVIRERHRYTLIDSGGRWMIDESTVLSSV
ncbi:MAG TPA: protein kinase [Actinophytocola sp.]|uniref:serine/threonine protein kinase n=1 Tax=Actinophytocola sp. TaxID=1872138 RepID=UPI002DB685FB|nr:protein kinase [Actinophytocola sp.]HEU5472892.1 protein kinase [Actinophytocola sp.]